MGRLPSTLSLLSRVSIDSSELTDPRANRGYVKQGRERVTQSSDPDEIAELRRVAPDVKESMEIGNDAGLISLAHQ